ncbi:hypothetical protein L6164_017151 [Bauhinia variegata]|uniref:Uncharacterized protein n=1 Tax=Bauhinia variegata TaxID=167791 RepID=A0ACB9N764_BAUVA|nr:hypothetical protein L6164_017151 [Bauhinia variegata]
MRVENFHQQQNLYSLTLLPSSLFFLSSLLPSSCVKTSFSFSRRRPSSSSLSLLLRRLSLTCSSSSLVKKEDIKSLDKTSIAEIEFRTSPSLLQKAAHLAAL